MNLRQLDNIIPKRWILLLRYYLPFFKKPAPFYFACRQLINDLKRTPPPHLFPLSGLPDLLFVLETYAKDVDLINVAKKIIDLISPEQYQQIDHLLLRNILLKFDPEDNQAVILNDVLQRIPDKVYKDIILLLSISENKILKLIKWCGRLADRFTLEDKLDLILSSPKQLVLEQRNLLYALAFTELETRISTVGNDIPRLLTQSEELIAFILNWQKNLNFSPPFLFTLFNHWLEVENSLFLSHIKALDINARFDFFKNLLASNNNSAKSNQQFLRLCPHLQRSLLINQLIEYFFNAFASEAKRTLILTVKPLNKNDPYLLLLNYLLENKADYPLNLFQFLALSGLAKKPLDLERLKKNSVETPALLEFAKFFSFKLQEYTAETSIEAIKLFIRENIMPAARKKMNVIVSISDLMIFLTIII
jgi:hypothetical protein